MPLILKKYSFVLFSALNIIQNEITELKSNIYMLVKNALYYSFVDKFIFP